MLARGRPGAIVVRSPGVRMCPAARCARPVHDDSCRLRDSLRVVRHAAMRTKLFIQARSLSRNPTSAAPFPNFSANFSRSLRTPAASEIQPRYDVRYAFRSPEELPGTRGA